MSSTRTYVDVFVNNDSKPFTQVVGTNSVVVVLDEDASVKLFFDCSDLSLFDKFIEVFTAAKNLK
jgi:hypothetical protein